MREEDAPLLAAWQRFVASDAAPFTVPGHKRRAGEVWPALGRLLDGDVPLYGGLAPIKDAASALTEAEARGARLWGADWCRYSTGGSTHANQVAALAVGRPGQPALVSRTAHRSTLSGLILAGLEPVWLPSVLDPVHGLPRGLALDVLERALGEHPDAAAVFCVEPSYVGTISDLTQVMDLAHAHGVPVVVDQAWAGHFGFHPAYPQHAIAIGADVMITSAHKVLPAYSQAALVLARTERLDAARLDRAFDLSFTTSPSGSILASVDAARAILKAPLGGELLDRLIGIVDTARTTLRAAGLTVVDPTDYPDRFDPAKLVVRLDRVDGNAIERALIAAGVPVEQADRDTLIPIVTMLDTEASVDRLCAAIVETVDAAPVRRGQVKSDVGWAPAVAPVAMSPRSAFFARHETVAADRAQGRISAELIAPYPPGIPVVVPGELITAEVLAALEAAVDRGVRIAYASDPSLRTYQVVIE